MYIVPYPTLYSNVCSSPPTLRVPQPGHSLGDTNVVSLKGVEGDTKSDGSDAESPHGSAADEGNTLLREVVDDA
jgi:hypothetical protein